jgi:hypothetical protein
MLWGKQQRLILSTKLLDAYNRVQTTRMAIIGLSNLNRGADKSINNFSTRVAKVIPDLNNIMQVALY